MTFQNKTRDSESGNVRRYRVLVALLMTVVVIYHFSPTACSQERVWTDQDGERITGSIEAVDIAIQIKRDDGVLITVPLSQLSAQDQAFVKNYLERNAVNNASIPRTADLSSRETLDSDVVSELVSQLQESYDSTTRPAGTLAILPFRNLRGEPTDEGRWLAETLITPFVNDTVFQVLERSQIEQLMNDHSLASTGVIDPTTAKRIGQLLGAETLVSGTIQDIYGGKRISARLIGTEEGRVLAVASTEITQSDGRQALFEITEEIANDLARQVVRRHDGSLRIGILTLADLTEENGELPEILADDFTLFLHDEPAVELIERQRLREVVGESRLTSTGAIGNRVAQQVGRTLSVDAVLIGSIVSVNERLTINARLVSVESGSAIASASVNLDDYREVLHDEPVSGAGPPRRDGVFLADRFDDTENGHLPDNWTSPSVMIEDLRGEKVLISYRDLDEHQVHIGDVDFPDDFELDWVIISPTPNFFDDFWYFATIGDISLMLWMDANDATLELNDAVQQIPHGEVAGEKLVKLSLQKEGPVVTAFLNDRRILRTRIEDFASPGGITLRAQSRQDCTLWKFIVTELEGRTLTD